MEQKLSTSEHRVSLNDLLDENNLDYSAPMDISVAKRRRLVRSDFQSTSVQSTNTATCYISHSDGYTNGLNSYLMMKISMVALGETTDGSTAQTQGLHSGLHIIKSATLTSKSGQELDRQDDIGILQHHLIKMTHSHDEILNGLSCMGYENVWTAQQSATKVKSTGPDQMYIIPLKYILQIFSPHDDRLLPNHLLAGARLDLTFYNPQQACTFQTAPPFVNAFTLSQMALVMDTIQLSDGVLSQLNKMASKEDGLELSFDTFSVTPETTTAQQLHIDSKRSVSKANFAMLVSIPTPATATAEAKADSFMTTTDIVETQIFRLGSCYYPQQAIVNKQPASSIEHYANSLYVFRNTLRVPTAVSYTYWKSHCQIPCASMERSQVSDIRGAVISNGRSLRCSVKFTTGSNLDNYLFVNFTKILQITPSQIRVGE